MINFFVNAAGSFGIRDYVSNRGIEMAGRFDVVLYEELTTLTAVPATGKLGKA